jgi:mycofactocin precursor
VSNATLKETLMEPTTNVATPTDTSSTVTEEIVIEEVSIDGMCGVY